MESKEVTPINCAAKVQPFKILLPSSTVTTTVATAPTIVTQNDASPKMTVSPVKLLRQSLLMKPGDNQTNIKLVTNALLLQDKTTTDTQESSTEKSVESTKVLAQATMEPSPGPDESTVNISREQRQLQESINSSLVLQQMIYEANSERKTRERKKRSQSPKRQTDSNGRKSRCKSMDASKNRHRSVSGDNSNSTLNYSLRSRSSSRVRDDSDNEQDNTPNKRLNMRSSNMEFAQKQKSFMKEIIKTQESAEESDADETSSKSILMVQHLPEPPKVFIISFISFFFLS